MVFIPSETPYMSVICIREIPVIINPTTIRTFISKYDHKHLPQKLGEATSCVGRGDSAP